MGSATKIVLDKKEGKIDEIFHYHSRTKRIEVDKEIVRLKLSLGYGREQLQLLIANHEGAPEALKDIIEKEKIWKFVVHFGEVKDNILNFLPKYNLGLTDAVLSNGKIVPGVMNSFNAIEGDFVMLERFQEGKRSMTAPHDVSGVMVYENEGLEYIKVGSDKWAKTNQDFDLSAWEQFKNYKETATLMDINKTPTNQFSALKQ